MEVLSLDNPNFKNLLFYACVLVVKMLIMPPLTTRQRFKNKAFSNPEDSALARVKPKTSEDVERVRRAHRNDLESIPIFLLSAFCYIFTNPSVTLTLLLLRWFTIARIAHTVVYAIVVVPQPARMVCFLMGIFITTYMTFQALIYFM